jgi:hypothetical protein
MATAHPRRSSALQSPFSPPAGALDARRSADTIVRREEEARRGKRQSGFEAASRQARSRQGAGGPSCMRRRFALRRRCGLGTDRGACSRGARPSWSPVRAHSHRPRLRRHGFVLQEVRISTRSLRQHDHRRLEERAEAVCRVRGPRRHPPRRKSRRQGEDGGFPAVVRESRGDHRPHGHGHRRRHRVRLVAGSADLCRRALASARLRDSRRRRSHGEDQDLTRGVSSPAAGRDCPRSRDRGCSMSP